MGCMADAVEAKVSAKKTVARGRRKIRWVVILLLLPVVGFLTLFFIPSLGNAFSNTFWRFDLFRGGIIKEFNFNNYLRLFTDEFYRDSMFNTFRFSGISTLIALLIGYPTAYFIAFYGGRWRGYLIMAVLSPLLVTVVIRALGWIILLGPGGFVDRYIIFWKEEPVKMIYNPTGVVIGLTQTELPYMIIPILVGLLSLDRNLILAAYGLGASWWRVFLKVVFPLSLPGVVGGVILAFIGCATAYATPAMLGGGRVGVLAYDIWKVQARFFDSPFAAALGFLLLVIVSLTIVVSTRIVERRFQGSFH